MSPEARNGQNPSQSEEGPKSARELLPLVYSELRALAAARLLNEKPGATLQPTVLVHEAWLRISRHDNKLWKDRRHFFASAAEAMRHILIDRARRRLRIRHGGGNPPTDLDCIELPSPMPDDRLLALDDALVRLGRSNPVQAEIVSLRFFVGLTAEETAQVLGISTKSVQRGWNHAKAWLYVEMAEQEPN